MKTNMTPFLPRMAMFAIAAVFTAVLAGWCETGCGECERTGSCAIDARPRIDLQSGIDERHADA